MCKVCNGSGKVHEYVGMGAVRIFPCACRKQDEERFIKILERFGLDGFGHKIVDGSGSYGEELSHA